MSEAYKLAVKSGLPLILDAKSLEKYGLEVIKGVIKVANIDLLNQFKLDDGSYKFVANTILGNTFNVHLDKFEEEIIGAVVKGIVGRTLSRFRDYSSKFFAKLKSTDTYNVDIFKIVFVYRGYVLLAEQRNVGKSVLSNGAVEIKLHYNKQMNKIQATDRINSKHVMPLQDVPVDYETNLVPAIQKHFGGEHVKVMVLFEDTDFKNNTLAVFSKLYPESKLYIVEEKYSLAMNDDGSYARSELGFDSIMVSVFLKLMFSSIENNVPEFDMTEYKAKFNDLVTYINKSITNFEELVAELGRKRVSVVTVVKREKYKRFVLRFKGSKKDDEMKLLIQLQKALNKENAIKCGYLLPKITKTMGTSSAAIHLAIRHKHKIYGNLEYKGAKHAIKTVYRNTIGEMTGAKDNVFIISAFIDSLEDINNKNMYHLFTTHENLKYVKTVKRIPYFYKLEFNDMFELSPEDISETDPDTASDSESETDSATDIDEISITDETSILAESATDDAEIDTETASTSSEVITI